MVTHDRFLKHYLNPQPRTVQSLAHVHKHSIPLAEEEHTATLGRVSLRRSTHCFYFWPVQFLAVLAGEGDGGRLKIPTERRLSQRERRDPSIGAAALALKLFYRHR